MAVQVQRAGKLSTNTSERRWRGVLLPATVLAIVVLVPLAVLMGTVLALGWQLQVIKTGSMEPRIPAGSLAVVEPIDAASVRAGMVIVFEDPSQPGRLVSHRAVKRLPGQPPVWQTQGDANPRPDPYPIHSAAIRGHVRWTIPRLGSIASRLHTRTTAFLLVGVPLALLAITELIVFAQRRRRPHKADVRPDPVVVYAVETAPTVETPHATLVDVFARREDAYHFIETQPAAEARTLVVTERELQLGAIQAPV